MPALFVNTVATKRYFVTRGCGDLFKTTIIDGPSNYYPPKNE
jgi:hypothetical protein